MTPFMDQLVAAIRRERLAQRLTLSELARRSDVSKSYLHSLEDGRVQAIGIETLRKIAAGLGVTVRALTGEIERIPNRDA